MQHISSWIKGYEGQFRIYTNGDVYSLKKYNEDPKGRLLINYIFNNRKRVNLLSDKKVKIFYIDRLVYETFNNAILDKKDEIIHLDNNLLNNNLRNLELKKFKKQRKKTKKEPKYTLHILENDKTVSKLHYNKLLDISNDIHIATRTLSKLFKSGDTIEIPNMKNL